MKVLAIILLLVSGAAALTASAGGGGEKERAAVEEIKKQVECFASGGGAGVLVRLKDGATIEGFIDRAGADHFYLVRTDEEAGTGMVVAYSDVAEIEARESSDAWRRVAFRTGLGARTLIALMKTKPRPAPAREYNLARR